MRRDISASARREFPPLRFICPLQRLVGNGGRFAYVSNNGSSKVSVIDTATIKAVAIPCGLSVRHGAGQGVYGSARR